MKILYYGGCWDTNIGNAFLDYGSMYTVKAAIPNCELFFASELARWFYKENDRPMENAIDMAEISDVDCVVVSGQVMYDGFIKLEGPILKKLSDRGVKIVFNGCGSGLYNQSEVKEFKVFLKQLCSSGFISRDDFTYHNYKDCFKISHNGLDCAYFLGDAFKAMPLTMRKNFIIYNFDNIDEPDIINNLNMQIIRTHHLPYIFYTPVKNDAIFSINLTSKWPYLHVKNKVQDNFPPHTKTLISNIPEDYLNLYANTYATYTNRIHACIATLAFGNYCHLFTTDENRGRLSLIKRIAPDEITQRLMKLEPERFIHEKQNQITVLKRIFEEQ